MAYELYQAETTNSGFPPQSDAEYGTRAGGSVRARGLEEYGLGAWAPSSLPAGTKGKLYQFNSTKGGSTTAVFVPDAALRKNPLSVLVWIHGDIIPCGDEGADAVSYVKSTQFPLARMLAESTLPFVLVVP